MSALSELPLTVTISLFFPIALLFVSWLFSSIEAFKLHEFRVLAVCPITQPFLAVVRFFNVGIYHKIPAILLFAALFVFLVGSNLAEAYERSRLIRSIAELEAKGYSSNFEYKYTGANKIDEIENVWMAPFMKSIYYYAIHLSKETSERSPEDISISIQQYDKLQPSGIRDEFHFKDQSFASVGGKIFPFRTLLENAFKVVRHSNPENVKPEVPVDLKSAAAVMREFYNSRSDLFDLLKSSISLKESQFFYHMNRHPLSIRMPHLSFLKNFSIVLNNKMLSNLVLDDGESAWSDWLALNDLIRILDQDIDFDIKILVKVFHLNMMVESLHAAQSLGNWDEFYWKRLLEKLDSLNLKQDIIAAMKTGIDLYTSVGSYTINHLNNDGVDLINYVSTAIDLNEEDSISNDERKNLRWLNHMILKPAPQLVRAFVYEKTRAGVEKYIESAEMVIRLVQKNMNTEETGGKVDVFSLSFISNHPGEYIKDFEEDLFPTIQYYFCETVVKMDIQMLLARIACRLEIFKQTHGGYPDNLDFIQSFALSEIEYKKDADGGFVIKVSLPEWFRKPQELKWIVTGGNPVLPEYFLSRHLKPVVLNHY